jgi:hypothetical protein
MVSARRLGWLAMLAAAVITGATAGCDPSPGPSPSAACAVPTALAGTAGQPADAPGGGALRVTEKGFSQVGSGGATVSLGAEVENTSKQVAYRARVTFAYADAQGKPAVAPGSTGLNLEIPMILPGQKIPVGAWSYVVKTASGAFARVAAISVDLGSVNWVASDAAAFQKITASPQGIQRSEVNGASGTLAYTMQWPFCRALTSRGVAMVFRDQSGAIVGGSIDLTGTPKACANGDTARQAVVTQSLPPALQEDKTEVYPYCDLAAALATGSGAPVN